MLNCKKGLLIGIIYYLLNVLTFLIQTRKFMTIPNPLPSIKSDYSVEMNIENDENKVNIPSQKNEFSLKINIDTRKGEYWFPVRCWYHSKVEQLKLKTAFTNACQWKFMQYETIHINAAGKEITIVFNLKPLFDEDKNVIALIRRETYTG